MAFSPRFPSRVNITVFKSFWPTCSYLKEGKKTELYEKTPQEKHLFESAKLENRVVQKNAMPHSSETAHREKRCWLHPFTPAAPLKFWRCWCERKVRLCTEECIFEFALMVQIWKSGHWCYSTNPNTAWWSEIGHLTSLDAPELHASSDVREPISLHQTVL